MNDPHSLDPSPDGLASSAEPAAEPGHDTGEYRRSPDSVQRITAVHSLSKIQLLRNEYLGEIDKSVRDVSWDILLELIKARQSAKSVFLSDLAMAQGISMGTLVRYINLLEEGGFISRRAREKEEAEAGVSLTLSDYGYSVMSKMLDKMREELALSFHRFAP